MPHYEFTIILYKILVTDENTVKSDKQQRLFKSSYIDAYNANPEEAIDSPILSDVANTMRTNPIALHDRLHQRSEYFALFCLYLL
jgi:hypothetical protein